MAYARTLDPSPGSGPICHHAVMSPVAAPEAATVPEAAATRVFARRRSLAALAEKPAGGLAARVLNEDDDKRLTVSAFNSGI